MRRNHSARRANPAHLLPTQVDVAVLCGGLGKRLRSVLGTTPKPMAPIADRPFLALLLDHVASHGFRRFVLCTGYGADVVESWFAALEPGYIVVTSREDTPLGTGGALRHAASQLGSDPVLVLNGDSFCAVPFRRMLARHAATAADVTIAVTSVERPGDYGTVTFGTDGRITAFTEKARQGGGNHVNAGVYLFRRVILAELDSRSPLSLEHDVFPTLLQRRLIAFRVPGPLLDIGTPARYEQAKRQILSVMAR
ncbi:MAG: nucleotidyltransferase family protein [Kiritimatiellae bacterium]|nr:nucleotidyltransferase family protein [Kiritimatiellia bacterium]